MRSVEERLIAAITKERRLEVLTEELIVEALELLENKEYEKAEELMFEAQSTAITIQQKMSVIAIQEVAINADDYATESFIDYLFDHRNA